MSAPEYEQFLYEHAARTRTTPLLINGHRTVTEGHKNADVAGRKWIITYAAHRLHCVAEQPKPMGLLLAGWCLQDLLQERIVSGVRHAERVERYAQETFRKLIQSCGEMMSAKKVQAELTLSETWIDRTTDSYSWSILKQVYYWMLTMRPAMRLIWPGRTPENDCFGYWCFRHTGLIFVEVSCRGTQR